MTKSVQCQTPFEAGESEWDVSFETPWYSTYKRGRWFAVGATSGRHPTTLFAVDSENRVCLVEVYRPALDLVCLETPRGFVDEGEDARTAAARELREEAGIEIADAALFELGLLHPDSGILKSEIMIYGARLDHPFETARIDGSEVLGCRFTPLAVLRKMVECGLVADAIVVAALARFDAAHPVAGPEALGVVKEIEIVDADGLVVITMRARRPDAVFRDYCRKFAEGQSMEGWHWRFKPSA